MKPLKDTCIVRWEKETETKTGIILSKRDVPQIVIVDVLDTGDEVTVIAPGDKVYCQHWSLTHLEDDKYLLHEHGALAKHHE